MKRATRLTTGFDDVVLAYLRGDPPPATLTKAQQDAACSLALLAAPPGHGVIGGQVVMLPEGCDRDNPHWKAWLDAEVRDDE